MDNNSIIDITDRFVNSKDGIVDITDLLIQQGNYPTSEPSGLFERAVKDPLVSLAKGATVGLGEAVVGLADIPTMGYAGKGVDYALKSTLGGGMKEAGEWFDEQLTPEAREAQRKVAEAKGFIQTIQTAIENPSSIVSTIMESAPSMVGGAGLGRMALRFVGKRILGKKGIEEAVKGLSKEAADDLIQQNIKRAIAAGSVGEGLITAGQNTEGVRQQTESGTLTPMQVGVNVASGALTGTISRLSAGLAKRLGITDIDTLLQGVNTGAKREGAIALLKGAIGSAITEGAFEELPQSAQEQMAQNIALGKPVFEGVPEAGAMGLLAGAGMGIMGAGGGMAMSRQPAKGGQIKPPIQPPPGPAPPETPPGQPPPGGQGFNTFNEFAGAYQDGATYDDLKGKRDEYSKRPDADPNVLADVDTFLGEVRPSVDGKIEELKSLHEANGITSDELISQAGKLISEYPNETDKIKSAFPNVPVTLTDALKKSESVTPFTDASDALNKSIIENLPALKANEGVIDNGLQEETKVTWYSTGIELATELYKNGGVPLDGIPTNILKAAHFALTSEKLPPTDPRVAKVAKALEGVEAELKKREAEPPSAVTVTGPPVTEAAPAPAKAEGFATQDRGAIPEQKQGVTPVIEVPVDYIKISEDVPQFKGDANEIGVVQELQGTKYRRVPMNAIIVWERLNGDLEVITGRHRLDLARRIGEKTIPAQIVKESEGFDKQKALTFDAEQNILDNQGTEKDYANYFRNTEISEEEAKLRGLLRGAKASSAWILGRYATDQTFNAYFRTGEISFKQAVAVSKAAPNDERLQLAGRSFVLKNPRATESEVENFVHALSLVKDIPQQKQGDLFGFDDSAIRTAEMQAKKAASIIARLKKDSSHINAAIRGEGKLELSKEGAKEYGIEDSKDKEQLKNARNKILSQISEWEKWYVNPELVQQLTETKTGQPETDVKTEKTEVGEQAVIPGASYSETFSLTNPETEISKPLSEQKATKDEDLPFQRGKSQGLQQSKVQTVINKALESIPNAPKVNVVQSNQNCPEEVQTIMEREGIDDAMGFTYKGEVYLVSDNLRNTEEVLRTLAHELTHSGLGKFFQRQTKGKIMTVRVKYEALMDSIYRAHSKEIENLAKTTHTHLNMKTVQGRRQACEEWLCNQSYEAQSKWYDKLVAIFHDLLRAIGLDVKLSDAEIRVVLQDAFKEFGGEGISFMTAWHGSPHDFDKFSKDKIGTGEGAQVYGYGLYFAGKQEIAEHYRRQLSGGDKHATVYINGISEDAIYNGSYPLQGQLSQDDLMAGLQHIVYYTRIYNDAEKGLAEAKKVAEQRKGDGKEFAAADTLFKTARIKATPSKRAGRLYQVELAPDEDEYLLWDKPLSEQSEKVKKIILNEFGTNFFNKRYGTLRLTNGGILGEKFYRSLGGDRVSSERLHSLGIRGIKYLDGSSRNIATFKITPPSQTVAGDWMVKSDDYNSKGVHFGTEQEAKAYIKEQQDKANYNYVIFDESDIEVTAKFQRRSPVRRSQPMFSRSEDSTKKWWEGMDIQKQLESLPKESWQRVRNFIQEGYVPITRAEADDLYYKGMDAIIARVDIRGPSDSTGNEGIFMKPISHWGYSHGMYNGVMRYNTEAIEKYKEYKKRFDQYQNIQRATGKGVEQETMRGDTEIQATQKVAESGAKFQRRTQQATTRAQNIPADVGEILTSYFNVNQVKSHKDYANAKAGDKPSAARLVRALVKEETVAEAKARYGQGVLYAYPHALEATGTNMIPAALANYYAKKTGGKIAGPIVQTNKAYHTGAGAMERMISRPSFEGGVVSGGRYVLVDDATTLGGTFAEMAHHIQSSGGTVVGIISLTNASRMRNIIPQRTVIKEVERRFGNDIRELFGIEPSALTAAEAGYLVGFRDANTLRSRAVKAISDRRERLLSKGIRLRENSVKFASRNHWKKKVEEQYERDRDTGKDTIAGGRVANDSRNIGDEQLSLPSGEELGRLLERQIQKTRGKTESRWLESAVLDLSIRNTPEFRVANKHFSSFGYTVIPIGKVEWLGLVNHTDKIALVSHLTGDSFSYFMSHEISHILSNQGNSAISAIKENLNTQHPDFVTINNILGMGEEFTREEIAASLVGGWDRYKHLLTGKDSDKSIQDARKAVIDSATKEPKTNFQRREKEAFEQASEPTPPEFDLGNLESKRKDINDYVNRVRRSLEFPEMVMLARDLLGGKFPIVMAKLRSAFGNSALGKFIPQGEGNILLKAGIFSDIDTASKVLAHEIGHLVDFLPNHLMTRGNILGRIASLHKYMKNYLEEFKGAPGLLTDEDRKRLQKEAREQVKSEEKPDEVIVEEIIKEIPQYEYTGITPEIILDLMKGRVEGKIAPELYEYLQRAETKEKKQIVLKAMKDMVDERVAQFGSKKQVGTETVRETVERVIPGVKYDQQTIYKRFKELLQKEVDKRVLYRKEVISDELKKLTKLWSPFDDSVNSSYRKYRWSSKELYADAFSVFINYPELMQKEAPTFYKAFLSWIESKPEVKETYDAYQKLANDREAVQERREKYFYEMQKGHKTKEQEVMEQIEAERKISPRSILRELYRGLIDRNIGMMDAIKKLQKAGKISSANALKYFKEERNYLAAEADFYLEEVKNKILDPLKNAGFTEDDIGYLGTLMRTATQRRDVANPGGMGGYFSDEQIEHLKNKLGTERFNTLKGLLEKFSELRQELVIPKLEEAGMYSEALLNTMKTQKNYLTFNVTKFMDKMYGPMAMNAFGKVYHTVGTFQDIQNPFIATIFKDISLMRAAEITKYKKELHKTFSENEELQDQIQPAEKKFNGTAQVFVEPKDPKMGMISYLKNGKVEAFYITKEIADDFNYNSIEAMHILKFFNALMMPVKALLVNRNPIWMFRNVVRDYLGTAQNIPGATVTNLLPYYRKAFMDAWGEVMQGKKLDVVQAMKKGKMLVIDRQYHLSDDMSDDSEFDKLYAKFGHYGEAKRKGIIEPLMKAWDFLGDLGKVSERAGKIAGYRWMKENTNMTEREIGHVVRSRIGTPDVYRRGAWQLVTNNLFLYSNVGKEGFRSSWESFQDNKAAYTWKLVKYNIMPKAVLALAALGAFGDDAEDIIKRISNYDKANYLVVPFNKTADGRAVYLRMPQSYTGQVLGAIMWDIFNLEFKKATESVAEMQPYSFNPVIKAVLNWGLYAMDTNPQDWYRGQNIVNRKEWDAGEPYRLIEMSKNTWNSLGGGLLYKFNKGQDPKGVWEQISSLPGLNILGSFLKESNQGLNEEYYKASEKAKRDSALKSMSKDEGIAKRERIKRQMSDAKSLYKKGYIDYKTFRERTNKLNQALMN